MLIGVVSDTHNNLKNIDQIISLFNDKEIKLVIHTGDITNANSLDKFSKLNANLIGVYGNNDRSEAGLENVANKNNFQFQEPPKLLTLFKRNIAIFHEPDSIDDFLIFNKNNFQFQEPPKLLTLFNRNIAIFHEPDPIDEFLKINRNIDIVLHGHTHRYRNEIDKDILFFNPGESAGMLTGKNAIGLVDLKKIEAKRIFF